jgi:diguanylate cyclase (GGDEF)-like protein/PAS domain S-box-containing protein
MNISLIRQMAVWLGLVLLSAMLFFKTQLHDMESHNRLVSTLGELQAVDATLNQDVIRARYRLLVNYDPLVEAVATSERLLQQLRHAQHHDHANMSQSTAIGAKLERLAETLKQKAVLVDYFKSDNAVLKNSLSYYPLALQQIGAAETVAGGRKVRVPTGLRQHSPDLLSAILQYIQSGDPERRAAAESHLNAVREYARAPALRPGVEHAARHTEVILQYADRVEALLGQILALPSAQEAEDLYRTYTTEHGEAMRNADRYRILLYLFSVLLLIYTAYVFHRLRQSARALDTEKRRLEVTLHSIAEAVVTSDARGRIEYLNPVAERLTGWSAAAARGRPLTEVLRLIGEHDRRPVEDIAAAAPRDGSPDANRLLLTARDGREIHVELSCAPIGDRSGAIVVLRDVTSARQLTAQLSWQATHDGLTGLVNRTEFENRLQRALNSVRERGGAHAVLYLDMDRFKEVNDTAGHAAGDEFLRRLAGLLIAEVRERDTVARIGGDEFAVLLENCPPERAHEIAAAMVAAIEKFRLEWDGVQFQTGASIGIAAIEPAAATAASVLRQADAACYAAKQLGGNRVQAAADGAFRACS